MIERSVGARVDVVRRALVHRWNQEVAPVGGRSCLNELRPTKLPKTSWKLRKYIREACTTVPALRWGWRLAATATLHPGPAKDRSPGC